MSRVACPRCSETIGAPRGAGRVRFVPLRILAIRLAPDGSQSLETVCPMCRADVSIPLPLPAAVFKALTVDGLRQVAAEAKR